MTLSQKVANVFGELADFFIPNSRLDVFSVQQRLKARVLVGIALSGTAISIILLTFVRSMPAKYDPSLMVMLSGAASFLLLIRTKIDVEYIGAFAVMVFTAIVSMFQYTHGLPFASSHIFVPICILTSMLIANRFWALINALYFIGYNSYLFFLFKDNSSFFPPGWTEAGWEEYLFVDIINSYILVFLAGSIFLFAKDKSKEELVKSQATILQQQQTLFQNSRMTELGKVSSSIAHEINNPLTVVMSNTKVLIKGLKEEKFNCEEVLQRQQKIYDYGQRIARIIEGMRNLSRDGSEDPFEKMNICELVHDVSEVIHDRVAPRGIELEVVNCKHAILVNGRYVQIYQVLMNLLNNAIDAIEKIEIRKIVIKVEDYKDEVLVSIIDSGAGIPRELEEEVFQPFFTTKEVGRGTGLGLAICSTIMQEHNGKLSIDRSHNDSRLILTFPKV
jgi:signal transduction histidine kinase